jgi:thioredoxin reductase (NADPH)
VSREVADLTIIGAGPVGLTAAFWAGMREASARIVDALPQIGGQLTALYPEKPIFDVPGHPRILAKDLVELHRRQTLEQFDVPVHLSTVAERLTYEDDEVVLHTTAGELRSRAVIVAAGHGAFEPRRLPELDLTPWEGRGAHLVVADKRELAGRRVLVVGGGDSACDWALDLLDVAEHVALVHRRGRFRAHEATVRRVTEAAAAGLLDLHVPYTLRAVQGDGRIERVTLAHAQDAGDEVEVDCDAVLLQLGFRTALGPLVDWGLEVARGAIVVDHLMATSLDRVWACGDVTSFDGKLKLIATGYGEAAVAVAQAVRRIRPDTPLQPGYSTDTGVPGTAARRG